MKNIYLMSGLGGALGVMLRVLLASVFPASIMALPTYILFVNVLGCFLMGIVVEVLSLYSHLGQEWRYFLVVGFLGGLTTFSSYIFEFDLLLSKQNELLAFLYLFLSIALGFLMYFLAVHLVRWLN